MVFCNGILYNLGVYLVLKVKMATDHTNISRTLLIKVTNFYTHKAFLIVIVGSMLLKKFILKIFVN